MSQWRTSASMSSYLPHNDSQEAFEADDLMSSELPPASPVFDLDDFLIESSTTHSMADHASVDRHQRHSGHRDSGAPHSWASWESATSLFHESATSAFLSNPSSLTSASMPPGSTTTTTSTTLGHPSSSSFSQQNHQQAMQFKFQDAAIASPQSVLASVYTPQMGSFIHAQQSPYQPTSASFSDYELAGIGIGNSTDLWAMNKLEDQQMQLQYHEIGRMPPPHGDQDYGQHVIYRPHSVYQQSQSPSLEQRRQYVPRRDSSVPPYSTEYRRSPAKAIFAASAPTPSILSNLTSTSPVGSPHSLRGASITDSSPSLAPASPQFITPSSPLTAQYSASPAQFSASPHQFVNTSPVFTSASPITFVNQTTQFSTSAPSDELSSAQEDSSVLSGISRHRKRRKTVSSDAEDDSDDRRDEDVPVKSELRPPKQAPSMWQVYFADWLQEHKIRHPHDKLNVAQAAKEAGQLYKNLGPEEKEDLKRRVQVEKEVRERRLVAWQRTLTPGDIKRENKFRAAQRKAGLSRRANIKDPNAPKKPLSAYFMFLARIRSDPVLVEEVFGGETETTRQSVLAARRWREMSDEEKKPFLTQAEHDKIQYEAQRKIYEEHASVRGGNMSRKQMTGTGYIVPQQMGFTGDITAAIMSARPSTMDLDDLRMVSYDPEATITARKSASKSAPIPIFASVGGTVRRRTVRKSTRHSGSDGTSNSSRSERQKRGPDSGESSEDDDEWVPGKSV